MDVPVRPYLRCAGGVVGATPARAARGARIAPQPQRLAFLHRTAALSRSHQEAATPARNPLPLAGVFVWMLPERPITAALPAIPSVAPPAVVLCPRCPPGPGMLSP